MRKALCVVLTAIFLLAAVQGAIGEDIRRTLMLPGNVIAGETIAATAPFGGMVDEVLTKAGDFVSAGQTIAILGTTKVYAPCDGTVRGLRAKVGDDAQFIQGRYTALMYLEPTSRLMINTDTKYAYIADENYMIHVGEQVYVGSRSNNSRVGAGFVTAVDGSNYTVEVTEGNLIVGDAVSIYRSAGFLPETKLGSGDTTRNADVSITSEGWVYKINVSEGDTVERGDVLMETVGGTTAYNPLPTNRVIADRTSIVASVDATVGASVNKGQTLATLYPLQALQVAVEVAEADLSSVKVGDATRIELANFYDEASIKGVVVSISGLSSAENEDPQYTVTIDFDATDIIRKGMSVNVYFNE